MRVALRSAFAKIVFALGCALLCLSLAWLSVRHYEAAMLATSDNPGALRAALRLEPGNAAVWEKRARQQLLADQDAAGALASLRAATFYNPHAASAWLLLATAAQVNGDAATQNQALQAALAVDPTSPTVAWEAANSFLARGETDAALREFRVVLAAGTATTDTLELCWRVLHDTDRLLRDLLQPRVAQHLALLQLLVNRGEMQPALRVWDRLLNLGQPFPAADALPFIHFLQEQHEPARAWAAWKQLAASQPALAAYSPAGDDLIVNRGFDEDLLGGGFDWRIRTLTGVTVEVDTSEFHGGRRSLAFTFDDVRYTDCGLYQLVPVDPNTHYEFSAFVHTQELTTAQGPRFILRDYETNDAPLLTTEEFTGSVPWRQITAAFTTSATTRLLAVRLTREDNAASLLRGKLWIDDVSLVRR